MRTSRTNTRPRRHRRHRRPVATVVALAILVGACSPPGTATHAVRDGDDPGSRVGTQTTGDRPTEASTADLAALFGTDERTIEALEALVDVEDVAAAGGNVQVATLRPERLDAEALDALEAILGEDGVTALRSPDEVTFDEITLFDEDDADEVFASRLGGIATSLATDGLVAARTAPPGGGSFLGVPEPAEDLGVPRRRSDVDPAADTTAEAGDVHGPGPALHAGAGEDGTPGAAGGHVHGDGFDSDAGRSVTRYVAHDGLPLYAAASFDADERLTFGRGDRVFVLDDLPVPVGDTVFVRVQAVDTAPFSVGWMPLYWLYATPVGGREDALSFTSTYGLFADAISAAIEETFYRGCDHYPQTAQSPLFPGSYAGPTLDPSKVPAEQRYACGEYPIGVTGTTSIPGVGTLDGKWLPPVSISLPSINLSVQVKGVEVGRIAVHEWGQPVQHPAEPIVLRPHLDRLDGQVPGDPYPVRDLATAYSGPAKERTNTYHVPKATPSTATSNSVIYDVPQVDPHARIHGNDTWLNISFEPPAGVTVEAEAYLTVCSRLPGGHIDTPRTPTNISLYTRFAQERRSHVTGIDAGGLEFSPMTACATAVVTEPKGNVTGGGIGTATDLVGHTPPAVNVRFVKGTIRDLTIRHTGSVTAHGDFDLVHGVALSILLSQVNGFLKQGADGAGLWRLIAGLPLKKAPTGPAAVEAKLDERFTEARSSLEGLLVDQLDAVVAQLRGSLLDPKAAVRDACDTLMPPSYREVTSRYYVLYLQCLEATREAQIDLVANRGSSVPCYDPDAFARVSEGAGWRSADDATRLLYVDQEEGAIGPSHTIRRPPWAAWGGDGHGNRVPGCGIRSELSTTVMSEYWPLLRCMERIVNEGVNHGWSLSKLRTALRSDCEVPAVKILCDVYGDSADLRSLWEERHGAVPNVGPYVTFCDYHRELTREPGSGFTS